MTSIALMILAVATAPVPIPPRVMIADYPASSLRNGEQGKVSYEVVVDQAGKATSCAVTTSSGHPTLDEAACHEIMRLRFRPATDDAGLAVAGTFKGARTYSLGD